MILVIGAIGRSGGFVTWRLLAQGQSVRAVTRTVDKPTALKKLGADGTCKAPR